MRISRVSGGVEFTVIGENTRGKRVDFAFTVNWSYVTTIFAGIRRAWREERNKRIALINELDSEIRP